MGLPAFVADMPGRQKKAGKLLAGFFGLMVLFTFLSRGADSLLVAVVSTARAGHGSITRRISVQGTVRPDSLVALEVPEGFLVKRVLVEPGSVVEAGDLLLELSVDHIGEQLAAAKRELEKAYLDSALEGMSSEPPEQESFREEELLLERAEEDRETILQVNEEKISRVLQDLDQARWEFWRLRNQDEEEDSGSDAADAALQEARKNILMYERQLEDAYQEAEKNQLEAERLVEDAKRAIRKAEGEQERLDAQERLSEKKKQMQTSRASLSAGAYQEKATALQALLDGEGKVFSQDSGVIVESSLSPGSVTSAGGGFVLGERDKGCVFLAQIGLEEGRHLSVGDNAVIQLPGEAEQYHKISSITPATEKEGYLIRVELPDLSAAYGLTGTLTVQKKGEHSGQLLPLSAIHSEGPSATTGYVLVLREKSTTMGVQTVVEKLPVELLEQDGHWAVVKGVLSKEDQVVVASSKSLSAGDRVRLGGEP